MQHQNLLAVALVVAAIVALSTSCIGRELRPSDHGLTYQENPFLPGETDEARSFFGPSTTTTTTTTTTTMTPPAIPLPLAQNISEGTWMDPQDAPRSREGAKIDHVKMALIVASGVCGLTGVVLLLVSGVIFLLRLQKRRSCAAAANGKQEEELRISATLANKARANGGDSK